MASKPATTDAHSQKPGKALRVDAQRNRTRVLQVAAEVFATEGLSVPVHEIARRAGVGTGTVSRHFPTKEDLFAAVLLDRIEQLTSQADTLADTHDAATAFFTFFATLVHEGAAHLGLAEALAGSGYDVETAAAHAGHDLPDRLRTMLARAQQAGAVRSDITYPDVKALMAGCLSRDVNDTHGTALSRRVTVVCDGLRTRP